MPAQLTTGVFSIEAPWFEEPTAAYAELEVDLLGQPLARLWCLLPDGFGHDTYGWFGSLYLRTDRPSGRVELLVEEEGEGYALAVEREWTDLDEEIGEALRELAYYERDAEGAFGLLAGIASDALNIRSLTDDDVGRISRYPMVGATPQEKLTELGRWNPPATSPPAE